MQEPKPNLMQEEIKQKCQNKQANIYSVLKKQYMCVEILQEKDVQMLKTKKQRSDWEFKD